VTGRIADSDILDSDILDSDAPAWERLALPTRGNDSHVAIRRIDNPHDVTVSR
jgi:hypothetical protein